MQQPCALGGTGGRTMSVLVVQYLIDNFRWPAGAAHPTDDSDPAVAAPTHRTYCPRKPFSPELPEAQ